MSALTRRRQKICPIGVIAVDAIYTPVERVNLTVENTRVGQITDFDKLTLDVYTKGTLDPDEAVSPGCQGAQRASEAVSLIFQRMPRPLRS